MGFLINSIHIKSKRFDLKQEDLERIITFNEMYLESYSL